MASRFLNYPKDLSQSAATPRRPAKKPKAKGPKRSPAVQSFLFGFLFADFSSKGSASHESRMTMSKMMYEAGRLPILETFVHPNHTLQRDLLSPNSKT